MYAQNLLTNVTCCFPSDGLWSLQIADHNLTVIATDGFSIEPIVVERIVSLSGERYDVVLNARNDLNQSKITEILFICFGVSLS